jgi:hypothetical protein
MYTPHVGRWLSEDPAGYVDGPNLYLFTANNPINVTDPSGLLPPVDLKCFDRPILPPSAPPPFPTTDTCSPKPAAKNATMPWGFNFCCCGVTRKKDRLKPSLQIHPSSIGPVGPSGGRFTFCGLPSSTQVGTGGCLGCIAVIIKCPSGAAVFHFTAGDNPFATLMKYNWPSSPKCEAIVCGGDDTKESNCLADTVLDVLKNIADIIGVSGASGCGINPDGTWYER